MKEYTNATNSQCLTNLIKGKKKKLIHNIVMVRLKSNAKTFLKIWTKEGMENEYQNQERGQLANEQIFQRYILATT